MPYDDLRGYFDAVSFCSIRRSARLSLNYEYTESSTCSVNNGLISKNKDPNPGLYITTRVSYLSGTLLLLLSSESLARPTSLASPPSSPIKSSRVRVSPTILLLLALLSISPSSSAAISYSDHCSSFVPESPPTELLSTATDLFLITGGHYTGGDRILGLEDYNSTLSIRRSLSFHPRSLSKTQAPGTLAIAGALTFLGGSIRLSVPGRSLRLARIHPRHPRTYNRAGRAGFDLTGFWSEQSGLLCMVGTGFGRSREGTPLELSAVFKLNYPNASSITTSIVSGTVESLDDPSSVGYFDPVRVLVYDEMNYEFAKVGDAVRSCPAAKAPDELVGLENDTYSGYRLMQSYQLGYGGKCSGGNCGPFGVSPRFMSLSRIRWLRDGKVRMSMVFSTRKMFLFNRYFEPERTLVGEGVWDRERKKLCLVACRVTNANGSSLVGDCTIRMSLWFPLVLSVEDMSMISGQIWSDRDENDSGYFDMVSFSMMDKRLFTLHSSHGLKYKYTKMDIVKSLCVKGDALVAGKRRYPDFRKPEDMSFSIFVKDAGGTNSWGYVELLFVGETQYGNSLYKGFPTAKRPVPDLVDVNHSHWNVSYYVRYGTDSNNLTEISAEGTYDVQRGMLCMVGCRHVNSSLDCGILVNIQLAPLNPKKGEYSKGKITSTRENSDPLFFKPLEISLRGMYRSQANESIRWIDIEIALVLLSLTLSCIFIGLQLYHTKKHPEVLSSISVTMLVILMLGHMIPLVLNFEALFFKDRNIQSSLVQTGGWLEVNEVIVSVITMVAFLLQSRLLQVALSARSADEGKQSLWNAERKSLLLCLPIYIVGGLIALLIHFRPFGTQQKGLLYSSSQYRSLREDLFPYAGLILDAFLFPQLLLNAFCNSKDKSLAPAFYVGTTVIRALPHVYDAYRARHYIPHLHSSYIYAGQNGDFYSSAWDFIVPCVGVLFAVLIFLQQRYGGTFILPRRIKDSVGYEMVPVVST